MHDEEEEEAEEEKEGRKRRKGEENEDGRPVGAIEARDTSRGERFYGTPGTPCAHRRARSGRTGNTNGVYFCRVAAAVAGQKACGFYPAPRCLSSSIVDSTFFPLRPHFPSSSPNRRSFHSVRLFFCCHVASTALRSRRSRPSLSLHRNNCSVGFALAPSSSHPAKLATPLLVARASLCRVPFRRRPKQSSVRATETRDTTVRVRRRRRERKRRKEEATAAERRRRVVKPWKRREALAKHDRIESSRAGSRCFEPSRVESSQVEPSRVESRAPCSAKEGWRSNQRGDDYAKGKEAERGRGKGSRARERQRESEINAGDGARGRRTESRQSEDGMGAAGWGKRLRPWLPWRPATNCRRPLLATGR